MKHCCVASWKASLYVLPPTSNIVTRQKFVVAGWRSMLQQVVLASTFFNTFFLLATTNFCCVTMFEVGGYNTANNAFQLATWQWCVVSCSKLLLVLLKLKGDWYFSFIIQIDNSDEAYELLREWKRERYVLRWMLKKLFGLRPNYVFFR